MKQIISVITGFLTLSAVILAVVSAVRSRKARRKPVMTFRELLRDNVDAKFLFNDD